MNNKRSQFVPLLVFAITLTTMYSTNDVHATSKDAFTSTQTPGFSVAPGTGITQMDGSAASLASLWGGIQLNHQVALGVAIRTAVNQIKPKSETIPDIYMDYWSVGGFAEYSMPLNELVTVRFPLYIGYGEVQMDSDDDDYWETGFDDTGFDDAGLGDASFGESNIVQIEPSVLLGFTVNEFVRMEFGAGYRFVGSMEYRNMNQSDIRGLIGSAGLRIGRF